MRDSSFLSVRISMAFLMSVACSCAMQSLCVENNGIKRGIGEQIAPCPIDFHDCGGSIARNATPTPYSANFPGALYVPAQQAQVANPSSAQSLPEITSSPVAQPTVDNASAFIAERAVLSPELRARRFLHNSGLSSSLLIAGYCNQACQQAKAAAQENFCSNPACKNK